MQVWFSVVSPYSDAWAALVKAAARAAYFMNDMSDRLAAQKTQKSKGPGVTTGAKGRFQQAQDFRRKKKSFIALT